MDNYEQSSNRNEQNTEVGADSNNLEKAKPTVNSNWKKEPQITELLEDLEFARTENTDQSNNIDGWLDLRNTTGAEAPKKAKVNRSSIQPKLIRKHNEWRYPALTEPFLNTDRMFEVLPRTGEDKPKADQNQIVLNWQFDTKINKVDFIDRYVRTAVDEGTVIVRVGWEREFMNETYEVPTYDYYPLDINNPEDQQKAQMLSQAIEIYQSQNPQYEEFPDNLKASVEASIEAMTLIEAVENGTETITEEKQVKNCPSLRIVNTKNVFIDPSCEGDVDKANFMIFTYEALKSDFLKKKDEFTNLDSVNWEQAKIQSNHGNPDHESETPATDSRNSSDKQKVLVYEYWGLYDIYDDGVLYPIVVTWIGNTIIKMIENPFPDKKPPFVIVPYMTILKSVFGEADASLLQDNQRIIGAVTRGMIDLMGRSANAQTGYAKGFLDPVNKRRFTNGEDFEFNPNGDPNVNIRQLTYPEIPRSAYDTITMQNQEAESLTGVKAFTGGMTGEAYGRVATGIRGVLDSAAMREMSILRRLAKGMQDIGQKIIAMNAVYLNEEEVVRVTNSEFIKVKKEDLAGFFDLKVDISTASIDEQKSNDLGMILQTVGPDMDPALRTIILAEIAKLKRMPHLADQLLNYQPQPDPIQQQMMQMEIQKLQADIELDMAKAEESRAKTAQIMQQISDIESGVAHERDVEKMGAQARGNRSLEVTKAMTKGNAAPSLIESAIGFNAMQDQREDQDLERKRHDQAMRKLFNNNNNNQSGQQNQGNLGQGFSDPSMVPPQFTNIQ